MPSIEETKRKVKESLDRNSYEADHDEILASLQDEIDTHNAVKDDLRRAIRESKTKPEEHRDTRHAESRRFRFKEGVPEPRKRKHRSSREDERRHRKQPKTDYPSPPHEDVAHPFPREPTNPDGPTPTDAFRESLFDALADDEGAQYWESVYSQPIHTYPRPTVETASGELEQMNDEDYAAYVKTKMWERKHPEIVLERKRTARRKKEEEEERTRAREEFIRRKEQAAWERAETGRNRTSRVDSEDEQFEHTFAGDTNRGASTNTARADREAEYAAAWPHYIAEWDKLKRDLLAEQTAPYTNCTQPHKRIPWPVLFSKPVVKRNIESFMRRAPVTAERSMLQTLKAERVRWHPDKVQQRFSGRVDEGTMKLVTGVFQIVDALFDEERMKAK